MKRIVSQTYVQNKHADSSGENKSFIMLLLLYLTDYYNDINPPPLILGNFRSVYYWIIRLHLFWLMISTMLVVFQFSDMNVWTKMFVKAVYFWICVPLCATELFSLLAQWSLKKVDSSYKEKTGFKYTNYKRENEKRVNN